MVMPRGPANLVRPSGSTGELHENYVVLLVEWRGSEVDTDEFIMHLSRWCCALSCLLVVCACASFPRQRESLVLVTILKVSCGEIGPTNMLDRAE